jgi:sigma-B regulation protein RsbU (phosphoserine phosphatase)
MGNLAPMSAPAAPASTPSNVEAFLLEVVELTNTTLDLNAQLASIAQVTRRVIDYEIFSILLLNEKTQELRMRFEIGHSQEVADRLRIKVGKGITGQAVARREAVLVNDVSKESNYINAHPSVRSELAVPMIAKGRVIGVLDLQSRELDHFTEEHRRVLTLLGSRLASGIENARLYTRISRQAQTLTVLNEISRELSSILDLDCLLQRIGELLHQLIDYHMFGILLVDESGQKLVHRFAVRFDKNVQIKDVMCIGQGLVGYAAQHKEAVLVPDVTRDPRYVMLNPESRSELCVPMILKDRVIGVLDLEHTKRGYFTEFHQRTITTLAAQVAVAIENARLYQRISQQEQRLERDLARAREIQMHLLPPCCPVLKNAQIAARYVPALAIGGDLYDFLNYSGGTMGIAVGDVSGKGAPAALFAALASGMLRSTVASEPSAAEMLSALNLALAERSLEANFVCLLYALWDDEQRSMQVANSGFPRPLFCHQGVISIVEALGLPLGLFDDAQYDEMTIAAAPGDVFVFFSDGILDAASPDGEQFGRARLESLVAEACAGSAEEIADRIMNAVNQFTAGADPFDDQTVVVLKVTK